MKGSVQEVRAHMLSEVDRIPKVNMWVPINRNYLTDDESGDESSDQDSDCSQNKEKKRSEKEDKNDNRNNDFLSDTLFVELIDALVGYQVKKSSCCAIRG